MKDFDITLKMVNKFDTLFNELNNFDNKKELNIGELSYNNLIFRLTMEKNYYEKLNKGDIVIFNHQTKQYRTFKFIEKTDFHTKFECENLTLLIIPFIPYMKLYENL